MPRIAIVDDLKTSTLLLKNYLSPLRDLEVSVFTDPVHAIAWCGEYEPDLVLVDYMMPEMDGLEFIRQLRDDRRLKDTPVIMISAVTKKETLYEALELGDTDFLRKPVDPMELLARTRNMLELRTRQRALKIANDQLSRLATTDTLTGLRNRRFFVGAVARSTEEVLVHGTPSSLAVIDIDFFKSVNDRFGHDGGDDVLRTVAKRLNAGVRRNDIVGRTGGEEFAVLFEGIGAHGAQAFCNRLLEAFRRDPIMVQGVALSVTLSIGLAEQSENGNESADGWLKRADRALFAAKAAGRNTLVLAAAAEPVSCAAS